MIQRAAEIADYTGRTLEGIAYKYNSPSRVSDDGWNSSYYEEIVRGADKKTLNERSTFPLHFFHRKEVEYGTVTFQRSADESALMFVAELNHSDEASALLEDIDNNRDVSVGADALRNSQRTTDYHGTIMQRAEIRLRELSLAPTGTGLYKGAEVALVRSDVTPRLDRLRKRKIFLLS